MDKSTRSKPDPRRESPTGRNSDGEFSSHSGRDRDILLARTSLQFKQIRPKDHFSYEVDYEIELPLRDGRGRWPASGKTSPRSSRS